MNSIRRVILSVVALCATPVFATAQIPLPTPPTPVIPRDTPALTYRIDDDRRSGPRFGAAYLIGGSVTAERLGQPLSPVISLFGWQLEHQFDAGPSQPIVPVTEVIWLVGGMEQGVFLPSISWLVGMRQYNGWEAALGPTITGAGVQLAFAAGVTRTLGNLNVPINIAVAPGRRGASVSITTGFNSRR